MALKPLPMQSTNQIDIAYMKDRSRWSYGGRICPLKRLGENGQLELAYLFGAAPVLRHGNIFFKKEDDRLETFESHEAIVAAGWRVD